MEKPVQICEKCCLEDGSTLHVCNICKLYFHGSCIEEQDDDMYFCSQCATFSNVKSAQISKPVSKKDTTKQESAQNANSPGWPKVNQIKKKKVEKKRKRSPVAASRLDIWKDSCGFTSSNDEKGGKNSALEPLDVLLKRERNKSYRELSKNLKLQLENEYSIKHHDLFYKKKCIRIGRNYQSELPPLMKNHSLHALTSHTKLPSTNTKGDTTHDPSTMKSYVLDIGEIKEEKSQSMHLWDPSKLSETQDEYLKKAKLFWTHSESELGHRNLNIDHKFEEICLQILHLCNYSVKKALFAILTPYSQIFISDAIRDCQNDVRQYEIYLQEEKKYAQKGQF